MSPRLLAIRADVFAYRASRYGLVDLSALFLACWRVFAAQAADDEAAS